MWVRAGMARAHDRVERFGTREHRQQVPVTADAEEHQVEHRPAIRLLESGRAQLLLELPGAPVGVPPSTDGPTRRERMDVVHRDADTAPVVVEWPVS